MSLDAGARLGPYEILAPIGKGGMGEILAAGALAVAVVTFVMQTPTGPN